MGPDPLHLTQEESWMVLAARALKEQDQSIRVSVNGALKTGGWRDRLTGDALTAEPITLRNEANEPVTAMITTVASPKEPLPAGGEGFEISAPITRSMAKRPIRARSSRTSAMSWCSR